MGCGVGIERSRKEGDDDGREKVGTGKELRVGRYLYENRKSLSGWLSGRQKSGRASGRPDVPRWRPKH
jgi:hypothetical protein